MLELLVELVLELARAMEPVMALALELVAELDRSLLLRHTGGCDKPALVRGSHSSL